MCLLNTSPRYLLLYSSGRSQNRFRQCLAYISCSPRKNSASILLRKPILLAPPQPSERPTGRVNKFFYFCYMPTDEQRGAIVRLSFIFFLGATSRWLFRVEVCGWLTWSCLADSSSSVWFPHLRSAAAAPAVCAVPPRCVSRGEAGRRRWIHLLANVPCSTGCPVWHLYYSQSLTVYRPSLLKDSSIGTVLIAGL